MKWNINNRIARVTILWSKWAKKLQLNSNHMGATQNELKQRKLCGKSMMHKTKVDRFMKNTYCFVCFPLMHMEIPSFQVDSFSPFYFIRLFLFFFINIYNSTNPIVYYTVLQICISVPVSVPFSIFLNSNFKLVHFSWQYFSLPLLSSCHAR